MADEEDVALSAFDSFCRNASQGRSGNGRAAANETARCCTNNVIFRSPFSEHGPGAYYAVINAAASSTARTGSVAGLATVAEPTHKADEWFMLEVIAKGDHLTTLVNGAKVVDFRDRRQKTGHIALPSGGHAPGTKVWFRKIEIKPFRPARALPNLETFVPLFNGKDVSGWQTFAGGTGGWKVANPSQQRRHVS